MEKLTVVILTKNESANIVDCIANAKAVSEDVLVIDSGSADDTVQLAKTAGARVVYRKWDEDFAAQRNFALENTDAEWILYLDADERLDKKLIASVKDAVTVNKDECYEMKRINCALGYPFQHGVYGPDKVTRLFKRGHFQYVNKIHEHAECNDPCKMLSGEILHYTTPTWEQVWQKTEQYTTIWAENAFASGKRTNIWQAYMHAIGGFVKVYLFQLGILDGVMGWKVSVHHAKYTYMKYAKLLALQRSKE